MATYYGRRGKKGTELAEALRLLRAISDAQPDDLPDWLARCINEADKFLRRFPEARKTRTERKAS